MPITHAFQCLTGHFQMHLHFLSNLLEHQANAGNALHIAGLAGFSV